MMGCPLKPGLLWNTSGVVLNVDPFGIFHTSAGQRFWRRFSVCMNGSVSVSSVPPTQPAAVPDPTSRGRRRAAFAHRA